MSVLLSMVDVCRAASVSFFHEKSSMPCLTLNTILIEDGTFTQCGPVAQLGEHLVCNQGVRGSNPLRSTSLRLPSRLRLGGHFEGKGCYAEALAQADSRALAGLT
jgi:hypothetical protein